MSAAARTRYWPLAKCPHRTYRTSAKVIPNLTGGVKWICRAAFAVRSTCGSIGSRGPTTDTEPSKSPRIARSPALAAARSRREA
jgi:hypothetical protein